MHLIAGFFPVLASVIRPTWTVFNIYNIIIRKLCFIANLQVGMPKIEQLWTWRYPNRVAIIFFFLCMHQTSNTRVNIPPRRVNILGKEFEAHNKVELHPLNWIISKNNRSHNRPNRATGFRLAQKWKMVSNRYKVSAAARDPIQICS